MDRPAHRHAAVRDGGALTGASHQDRNRELLARYFDQVWGRHDPEAAREFLAPSYRRHLSPTAAPLDADGQVQRLASFMAALPDAELAVGQVMADGDLVAFRSTMTGTHQGELLGIAATGRRVEVHLLDMIRVVDGRFSEHWGGPDLFDLARQLREE